MPISPPSDIVLDVAKAADPARYQIAAERLARLSSTSAPIEPFTEVLDGVPATGAGTTSKATPPTPSPAAGGDTAAAGKAYRSFEAMTLATFIESAFPENATEVFGSGTAGSVWKSILAEQIANQMSKAGGIGIADQIARATRAAVKDPDGGRSADASPIVAPALVSTIERGFLKAMDKSDSVDSST